MYIEFENALTITRALKNNKGEIISYELDNGEKVDTQTLTILARQGAINGIHKGVDKSKLPSDVKFANLTNIKEFE